MTDEYDNEMRKLRLKRADEFQKQMWGDMTFNEAMENAEREAEAEWEKNHKHIQRVMVLSLPLGLLLSVLSSPLIIMGVPLISMGIGAMAVTIFLLEGILGDVINGATSSNHTYWASKRIWGEAEMLNWMRE